MSGILTKLVKPDLICAVALACLSLACTSLPGGIITSAEAEAQREAEKFWATQVTKCGESYYRKEVLPKKGDYVLLYEMKEPTVLAEPRKLSDADRLNGIEWEGRTVFSPKSSRVWAQDPGSWYEWKKGMGNVPELSYPMRKVNGQWAVDTKRHWTREETSKYVPVDCSQIPESK
jgi:hypothetical protein